MTYHLVMIVRDEAARIDECLESAKRYCDTATIVDTGSTDDTIERCERWYPGSVTQEPWQGFGHNRSDALRKAQGKGDWLLCLDADMTVEIDEDFEPNGWEPLPDAYMLKMALPGFEWRLPLLVRGDLPWQVIGAVHAYMRLPDRAYTGIATDKARVQFKDSSSPEKTVRQAALLEEEIERTTARNTFYLAQTYRELGRTEESKALYCKRAAMKAGFAEEAFYSAYMAAVLEKDWLTKQAALVAAWEMRPHRLEPLHELVRDLNRRGQHFTAYMLSMVKPLPVPDTLFIHRFVWDWGMAFQRSIAAWHVGKKDECRVLSEALLRRSDLPADVRRAVERNLTFCPIDWDGWRARYDEMGYDDHRAMYDRVFARHPTQQQHDPKAARAFVERFGGPVLEIGGWQGHLARDVWDALEPKDWLNVEICRGAAESPAITEPGYQALNPDVWPWELPPETFAGRRSLVLSHVIEHMRLAQLGALIARLPDVRYVYIDAPLAVSATNWGGYEGSHVMDAGWTDIEAVFTRAGFEVVESGETAHGALRVLRRALPMFDELVIETASGCNRECSTCLRQTYPVRDPGRFGKLQYMPAETVHRIIDQASAMGFTGTVCLQFFNEPLMDRRLAGFARYAKSKGFADVFANTNGDLLTPARARRLDGAFDRLVVSLYENDTEERREQLRSMFTETRLAFTGGKHVITHHSPWVNTANAIAGCVGQPCRRECGMRMIVRYDGEMLLCCEDIGGLWNLGNVADATPPELWHSDKHQTIIETLDKPGGRREYDYCRICPRPDSAWRGKS